MAWVPKVAGDSARCYDLSDGLGAGLAMAPTTPKNIWSPVQLSGIDAPTFSTTPWDPSTVTQYAVMDANCWWVSGSCDIASVSLSFVIVYFNSSSEVMMVGPTYMVSTSNTYEIASTSRFPIFGAAVWDNFQNASFFGVIITFLPTGSWDLQFNLL